MSKRKLLGAEPSGEGRKTIQRRAKIKGGGQRTELAHYQLARMAVCFQRIPYNRQSQRGTFCPSTTFASGSPRWNARAN